MADLLTLQIKNNVDAVQSANEAVARWLEERGTAPDVQYFANLAIEEIATNCIKYGYVDAKEHSIQVSLRLSRSALELTITDDGQPFNPLKVPAPNLNMPTEERTVGGLGIHLVRKMADGMEYVRESGLNRLNLRKLRSRLKGA